jgi:hypothetical protein
VAIAEPKCGAVVTLKDQPYRKQLTFMASNPRAREAVKPNRPTNRRCLAAHGSKGLKGSTLYTSGEPCARSAAVILSCVSRASLISDC